MRVYGWEDCGVLRGEMEAANVPAAELDFGDEHLARELGWEACFMRFADARCALIARMEEERVDPELIDLVRKTKARDVPVRWEASS